MCVTGSAIVVPGGSLTGGEHALAFCTWATAAHVALAAKLVFATPFIPYFLTWLLNGTIAATPAHLMTTQLALVAKCGGTLTKEAASKPAFSIGLLITNGVLVPRSPTVQEPSKSCMTNASCHCKCLKLGWKRANLVHECLKLVCMHVSHSLSIAWLIQWQACCFAASSCVPCQW